MEFANTSQRAIRGPSEEGKSTSREPLGLDAASWVALAAFIAYIGVGLLA